jgi:UDP-2-acetamido-3-amino-2,3-dideoxy-glucuronate N-acetyltransferase
MSHEKREAAEAPVNPPKIGLIGCGQWGRNIVRNLVDLDVPVVVHDASSSAVEWLKDNFPSVETVESVDDLLRDGRIAAVMVATPAGTHAGLAHRALEAEKDVFVEKPMALTVGEGRALCELAERRGRILMVGHLLEYHPAVRRLIELVRAGELGKIYYIYSNRLSLGRFRREENALWSFAPHDVHVLLRLLGEPPVEVVSFGGNYLQSGVTDVTMTLLTFESGVKAHIFVSWLHPVRDHSLVVVGERKMALFEANTPGGSLTLYPHRVEWIDRLPVAVKGEGEEVAYSNAEPLREECLHFLECVRNHQRPRTDGQNGVQVLEVLEACQDSLDRGGVSVGLETKAGRQLKSVFIHPTSIVSSNSSIGEGTKVWHYSHIMEGVRMGRDCVVGQTVFVGRNVVVGNNVKIQNNVSIYEGVHLEDAVFCGPSMVFTNVIIPRSEISRKNEFQQTLVKRGATLGANSTILCGNEIGKYALIGAGAVVTKDVPDYGLVVGNPGRLVGWVCQCGVRLDFTSNEVPCSDCDRHYARQGETVVELLVDR